MPNKKIDRITEMERYQWQVDFCKLSISQCKLRLVIRPDGLQQSATVMTASDLLDCPHK